MLKSVSLISYKEIKKLFSNLFEYFNMNHMKNKYTFVFPYFNIKTVSKSLQNIIFILFFSILVSCESDKTVNIPTFTVNKTNYEDILEINGTVEPVEVYTFFTPPRIGGKVIFIIEDGTPVKEGDVICILEDKEREKNYEEFLGNLAIQIAGLDMTKVDLEIRYALLEAQVQNNEAETRITNLDSAGFQFLTPNQQRIKRLEQEKSEIVKQKLKSRLKALSVINQSEVRKQGLRIMQFQNRVESTKAELETLTIKATHAGIAVRAFNPFRRSQVVVGDEVWEGLPLVFIPEMGKMKVKIYATEGDFKLINENDSVEYTFDAMPENKAYGKILKKTPVGAPLKENSKVKFFEIEASVDKMDVVPQPAFSANCKIMLNFIPDTIVIPQVAIFEQDSINVVYVQKGKSFEKRQVLTGTSSSKSAIIIAGLKPKEVISLSKPQSELVQDEKLLSKEVLKKYKTEK